MPRVSECGQADGLVELLIVFVAGAVSDSTQMDQPGLIRSERLSTMITRYFTWGIVTVLTTLLFTTAFAQETATEPGWWMTPHRMIQTNLREIDATMDIDLYVREVQEFGANVVLFNVGGIVANYPTELPYPLAKHAHGGRSCRHRSAEAARREHQDDRPVRLQQDQREVRRRCIPEWLYVSEKGEIVNYNGQVHTCLMGGYQQDYMLQDPRPRP